MTPFTYSVFNTERATSPAPWLSLDSLSLSGLAPSYQKLSFSQAASPGAPESVALTVCLSVSIVVTMTL